LPEQVVPHEPFYLTILRPVCYVRNSEIAGRVGKMLASRRALFQAFGAGLTALPTISAADAALAQSSGGGSPPSPLRSRVYYDFSDSAKQFLDLFESSWRNLNPQVRAVLRMIYAQMQGLGPPAEIPAPEMRRINSNLSFYLNAGAPALPHVEERTIPVPSGHTRVRLYDPGTSAPAPTVILIHGGGWVFGDLDVYDGFARQIATRSGLRCLSTEYALAPEHPFPAPLDDCIAAVRWAATEGASLGIDPRRITLIGDSAGANLALGTCLALRNAGESLVRGAALAYGAYSLDLDTPSVRDYGGGDYFLGKAEMARYWHDYLPTEADRRNPLAVPLLADLKNLPPLYIGACEFDPLRDDSERLAERAKAAGLEVEFRLWTGMIHAAISLMGWVDYMAPEADRIGAFLRRVTAS
jgi:acetyl esterase